MPLTIGPTQRRCGPLVGACRDGTGPALVPWVKAPGVVFGARPETRRIEFRWIIFHAFQQPSTVLCNCDSCEGAVSSSAEPSRAFTRFCRCEKTGLGKYPERC